MDYEQKVRLTCEKEDLVYLLGLLAEVNETGDIKLDKKTLKFMREVEKNIKEKGFIEYGN